LTVYGHLFDSDLDALADRLDERPENLAAHMLHDAAGPSATPEEKAP
jgi:hypothetical protein